MEQKRVENVEKTAKILRRDIIDMLGKAGSGHPGGSLSSADIVAALFFEVMNFSPANRTDPNRDRFVLSKGHAAPVLYAALAEKGFFDKEWLNTLRQLHSPLQGHPDMRKVPGVEASTGSLGQGLAWAVGMALAGRLDRRDYNVFALLGDGELEEGMIWEAVMAAGHYKLDKLTAIVDLNGLQIDGRVEDVIGSGPVGAKFAAFGWNVLEINGHDAEAILTALEEARAHTGGPTVIVAHTVKGKGVSFMEDKASWHGTAPNADEVKQALSELA